MIPTNTQLILFIDKDGVALHAYPGVSGLAALAVVLGGHARGWAAEIFGTSGVLGGLFELKEAVEVAEGAGFDALVVAEGEEDGADEGLGGLGEVVKAEVAGGCEGRWTAAPGARGCWFAHWGGHGGCCDGLEVWGWSRDVVNVRLSLVLRCRRLTRVWEWCLEARGIECWRWSVEGRTETSVAQGVKSDLGDVRWTLLGWCASIFRRAKRV